VSRASGTRGTRPATANPPAAHQCGYPPPTPSPAGDGPLARRLGSPPARVRKVREFSIVRVRPYLRPGQSLRVYLDRFRGDKAQGVSYAYPSVRRVRKRVSIWIIPSQPPMRSASGWKRLIMSTARAQVLGSSSSKDGERHERFRFGVVGRVAAASIRQGLSVSSSLPRSGGRSPPRRQRSPERLGSRVTPPRQPSAPQARAPPTRTVQSPIRRTACSTVLRDDAGARRSRQDDEPRCGAQRPRRNNHISAWPRVRLPLFRDTGRCGSLSCGGSRDSKRTAAAQPIVCRAPPAPPASLGAPDAWDSDPTTTEDLLRGDLSVGGRPSRCVTDMPTMTRLRTWSSTGRSCGRVRLRVRSNSSTRRGSRHVDSDQCGRCLHGCDAQHMVRGRPPV